MNTNPEHKTQTQNTEDKNTNTWTQIQEHKTQTDLQQEHKRPDNGTTSVTQDLHGTR